ncbi:MAG: DNA replication and repair protein RecF, partial [Alphaproteobacteria bacterium]
MALNAVSLAHTHEAPAGANSARTALAVTGLCLTAYRNYSSLRIETDPRPVVLTGANGAGKTNLLEALSYLGPGRGLRGARLADVDYREVANQESHRRIDSSEDYLGAPWAVAATLTAAAGPFNIGTGRDGASQTARRIVRIDGRPVAGPAALAERVSVLWLTPTQDRLFLDRPNARRRYLDKLVAALAPDHARRLSEYE